VIEKEQQGKELYAEEKINNWWGMATPREAWRNWTSSFIMEDRGFVLNYKQHNGSWRSWRNPQSGNWWTAH
jgi:hypothetical protein